MLEAKTYKVKIVGSFTGASQEKKTPYVGLELETESGEFIDWMGYLTDNTAKRVLKTLADVGFRGKKLADLSDESKDMDDLFDHNPKLSAVIELEEYTNASGEIKNKPVVKWLNTGSFGAEKVDHKKSVAIFKETQYDGMMKEIMGTVKPKAAKTAEVDYSADDIPF